MQNFASTNDFSHSLKTKNTLLDYRNYFLVVFIVLLEDSPFFREIKQPMWFVLVALLLLAVRGKSKIFNKNIFGVLLFTWFLIALQFLVYGGGFTPAIIHKPIVVFYIPFLVFILMGFKYFKYFFYVIYFSAIYTSAIYLFHTFNPTFYNWLMQAYIDFYPYTWSGLDWPRTLLIYNIPTESGYFFMRNSGIFHEPGAYAFYLMFAIILNTYFTKKPFNNKNIFLSIVMLTTFSTAGYLMLFVFLAYAITSEKKMPTVFKPVVLLIFAGLIIFIYQDTSFMAAKVERQFNAQTNQVEAGDKNRRGRFYAFGMSIKAFLSNPVTGRGIIRKHKYDVGEKGSFGYGFAGLFAKYGILFGLFYMFYFIKGFKVYNSVYNMPKYFLPTSFIVLNMGLLTQAFFLNVSVVFIFIVGLLFKEVNYRKNRQI